MTFGIDAPGTVCAFASRACTHTVAAHGGFDEHHEWPISLGGPDTGPKLALCPNHHRRQHSLVRYLVETDEAGGRPDPRVLRTFARRERQVAASALQQWQTGGRPHIDGWPCPAARRPS